MAEKKLRVHFSDVPQDLQVDAVEWAAPLIEGKKPDSNIAQKLKAEFDKKYHPSWHVIVGKQFGAYVSNEEGSGLYFTYGQTSILLFKAG